MLRLARFTRMLGLFIVVAIAILAAIEAWATSQGCTTLYLQTGADNAAAISLYESSGFELAGRYHTRVLMR
ncbi:MAG: GNAT family N-acetyltransferase [Sphingomonadales bacterium]|nr:GNAT family N-acetyltransferase [Sphingomonadales bacterium]